MRAKVKVSVTLLSKHCVRAVDKELNLVGCFFWQTVDPHLFCGVFYGGQCYCDRQFVRVMQVLNGAAGVEYLIDWHFLFH